MKRVISTAAALAITLAAPLTAQDLIGFDRANFGQVVLSGNQSAGADTGDMQFELSVGSYNNESIRNYSSDSIFATMGRSVGRLDILTDAGIFPCTAFIVDEKHILTNYHCVPGILDNEKAKATRIDAVQFVAGYTQQGVEEGTKTYFVSPTPVESAQDLDYSLLEVIGNPSAQYGKLALSSREPHSGDPYWVIGHPMGEAQRISREKCRANAPALSNNQLLHTCDTLPGNSGSPVIDASLQQVVGLHHAGSSKDAVNFAIPMGLILKRSKVLAASLNNGPRPPAPNPNPNPGPSPTPPNTDPDTQTGETAGTDVCDGLYAEAKAYDVCFAYQAYANQCTSHPYVGFAKGYIKANCGIATAPAPDPAPQPAPQPDPTPTLLRPWCGASYLNPTEKTICSDAYLASLDKEMARIYGQKYAGSSDKTQGLWLRNDRDACGSNYTCIRNAMNSRIAVLNAPVPSPNPNPNPAPQNYTLEFSRCYIVVASRTSLAEAQSFIRSRLSDQSAVRVFRSDNGFYGISYAVVNRSDADYRLQQWKSQASIPNDSYCSSGRNFVQEINWRGGNTTPPPVTQGTVYYVDNNNDGGLNLRSGPSTAYGITLEMSVGLKVTMLTQQAGWMKLRLPNGTEGWASAKYLTRTKPWVQKCTARVINITPPWSYNTATGDGFLAVRSNPSASKGRLISEVYKGDTVRIVAQRNGWARLQCVSGQCKSPYRGSADAIGWSNRKYLSISCQ